MRGLAKVNRSEGTMEFIDRDQPTPSSNEALVEIDYAGLCGSDVGIYKFKSGFERMDLPTVIGHEYTGRIIDIGEAVSSFEVGDRVIERPIRYCGDCYQCKVGEQNLCQNAVLTGIDRDGAFQQYITVPEQSLHPIPEDISPQHAATAEPTSICSRAVVHNSRVTAGDRVLVEGPGPIGLITAQIAAAQGGNVVVSGVGQDAEYRLPFAENFGFRTINIAEEDMATLQEEFTDGIGFDVIFDATGHPAGLTTAVDEVRKGGQIVLIGQTGETTMSYTPLVRAEVDLQCSYTSVYEDYERAIRMIQSGDVDSGKLIDERFSLLNPDQAFEMFINGQTCKPVFDVSEIWE